MCSDHVSSWVATSQYSDILPVSSKTTEERLTDLTLSWQDSFALSLYYSNLHIGELNSHFIWFQDSLKLSGHSWKREDSYTLFNMERYSYSHWLWELLCIATKMRKRVLSQHIYQCSKDSGELIDKIKINFIDVIIISMTGQKIYGFLFYDLSKYI